MTDFASVLDSKPALDAQQLEALSKAARAALSWDVEHRPSAAGSFASRVLAVRKAFLMLESRLAKLPSPSTQDQNSIRDPRAVALLEL